MNRERAAPGTPPALTEVEDQPGDDEEDGPSSPSDGDDADRESPQSNPNPGAPTARVAVA
jgi:hypothetical protein